MIKLYPVRGTHDLLGKDIDKHNYITKKFQEILSSYNFKPISTPIIENSDIYNRSLGIDSDVVMKEMYTFADKSGDMITMRPEGTAGVARAFISNGYTQKLPFKVFYQGPMFRYERPQKGRLRQFHQIGVEYIGNSEPSIDLEVISSAIHLLKELGLRDKVKLEINSLGDQDSRKRYKKDLLKYLNKNKNALSDLSKDRLNINPLRILDSKQSQDINIVKKAPKLTDYLTEQSSLHLNKVLKLLKDLNIDFDLNPFLVRGLDYYCHTTFEFISKNDKMTVLAGGRYDGLTAQLGGPNIGGIGWAAGIERLALLINNKEDKRNIISVLPIDDNYMHAYKISQMLIDASFKVDLCHSNNIKKNLKYANKINASHAVLIGDDEVLKSIVKIKNLVTGDQDNIDIKNIVSFFEKL